MTRYSVRTYVYFLLVACNHASLYSYTRIYYEYYITSKLAYECGVKNDLQNITADIESAALCVCVYTYSYASCRSSTCTYIHIYAHIYVPMLLLLYSSMHAHMSTHIRACTCVRLYVRLCFKSVPYILLVHRIAAFLMSGNET